MEACLIVTYRCNARCQMCHTWQHPSRRSKEFSPELIRKLPDGLRFINITGGEPFLRTDLDRIIEEALVKTRRLVISTNGYFTDRITELASRFGDRIGIRVSLEGLAAANDELRGMEDGFERGLSTLKAVRKAGLTDVGFGITLSDRNARDMMDLYRLSKSLDMEFATAVTHNSYYFHKHDNVFKAPEVVAGELERLARDLLASNRPKHWFRGYFNMGLANKVRGGPRPLPCRAGTDLFFMDPFGNIMPCNGSETPMIMGNLHDQSFDEIWNGPEAAAVRERVRCCDRGCWMIGSAAPAMKKRIWTPALWVLKNKLKVWRHGKNARLDPAG